MFAGGGRAEKEIDGLLSENGRPDMSVKEKKNIVVRDYNKIVLSI